VRALTPKAAIAAVLIAVASPASAAVITHSAAIPSDQTDFSTTVSVPKFDPTLGTLLSVAFTLFGEVTGDLGVENRNRSNAVAVTSRLEATLTLFRPDGTTLVVTVPNQVFTDSLARYDRTLDFGGTSGRTHAGIDASSSNSFASSLPFDLALFTGSGSIVLPMTANGTSSYDGTSNISFQADSDANGLVTVAYTYRAAAVPEPMALSLFGVGLAGLGVAAHRRRRRRGGA
jgi:hypothetical protein